MFMKDKSETLSKFKKFKLLCENELGVKIKTFRSDNGTEYTNKEFRSFCQQSGIKQQFTAIHTPQQNGTAERMNRTLTDTATALMSHFVVL